MSRIHGGVSYLFLKSDSARGVSFIFENLGEINTQFENILTCLDGFESCLTVLLNLVKQIFRRDWASEGAQRQKV